ncbi:hypothetical protein MMC19_001956 [Ptychographa xylographoides]|nr:hypothetical protein [Ptychographa xylographoides]
MSRSKNSPRPVSNRQSRRSRYQEIPEFSVRERVDSRAGEQKSKDHPNEKPALESRAGKPDQGTKCKTGSKRVTLLLRIRAQKTTKSCESPVPLCTVIRKRHLGEENDDVLITLRFKRRRGRTTRPKNAASDHNTAESPQDKKSDPTFKPSASTFQASKWLSIDRSDFDFISRDLTRRGQAEPKSSDNISQARSMFMQLLEAQVRVTPEPSSSQAKSAIPIIEAEEQSHQHAEPVQFVSALDKFNELIPGDDALQRFEDNPYWCLANKKGRLLANNQREEIGSRCRWRMAYQTQSKIAQLLAELAELNIYANRQDCLDKLVELTMIAVCHNQKDAIIVKLKLLLQADRLRRSSDMSSERHRTADQSGSIPITRDSGPGLARKVGALQAPITTSTIKISYWLRDVPKLALHYLPEYRPYSASKLCPRSVRECVIDQAKESLFLRDPGCTSRFQELDERLDGYLYIYWNRASFGLVKIGCTTRDVKVRLQEWEEKCGHLAEEHYRSPFRVKHVARLEKLIHAEFLNHRVVESYCRGCDSQHIEWFRGLDLALVIRRIEAWTAWIMTAPYHEGPSGSWRLKHHLESPFLDQICAPTAPTTPAGEPGSPSKKKLERPSVAKDGPRYNLRRRRARPSSVSDGPSSELLLS